MDEKSIRRVRGTSCGGRMAPLHGGGIKKPIKDEVVEEKIVDAWYNSGGELTNDDYSSKDEAPTDNDDTSSANSDIDGGDDEEEGDLPPKEDDSSNDNTKSKKKKKDKSESTGSSSNDENEGEDDAGEFDDVDVAPVNNYVNLSRTITESVFVHPEERMTSNHLSSFEYTEIISIRSTQIAKYNNPMVDIFNIRPKGVVLSAIEIAEEELKQQKCPLLLIRDVGELLDDKGMTTTYSELWNPNEMVIPPLNDV